MDEVKILDLLRKTLNYMKDSLQILKCFASNLPLWCEQTFIKSLFYDKYKSFDFNFTLTLWIKYY